MKSRKIDNQTLASYCFMLFSLDEKKKHCSAYQHATLDRGIIMRVSFSCVVSIIKIQIIFLFIFFKSLLEKKGFVIIIFNQNL